MHHHRTAGVHARVAAPGTIAHEHQRRVLLEVAMGPEGTADEPAALARVLGFSLADVERAADVLVACGLVTRDGSRLVASGATRAIEELWPLGR